MSVCVCVYKFHTIHERSESVLSQTSSEGVKWGPRREKVEGGERGGSPIEL